MLSIHVTELSTGELGFVWSKGIISITQLSGTGYLFSLKKFLKYCLPLAFLMVTKNINFISNFSKEEKMSLS